MPEDNVDLLLEQLAVGFAVQHRRAESFYFTRVVARPTPKMTRPLVRISAMAKSSARRRGCHIGAMLNPHPILIRGVTWARCTASMRILGRHS